jgi:hypothetical protein
LHNAVGSSRAKKLPMRQGNQHCCFGITFAVKASVIKFFTLGFGHLSAR